MQRRRYLGAAGAILAVTASIETHAALADPFRLPSPRSCDRVHNIDIPDGTQFQHVVPFQVGRIDLEHGDRIVITEVLGTRPTFEVDGIYLVRGEYVLSSAESATLNLNVTATTPGEGCTSGNPRGRKLVRGGSGTFELASPIPYVGWPHVWFSMGGQSKTGVYFGSGAFLNN